MSRKVLVVDHQLFMLRLIQHTLEKAGYQMIPARSRHEAQTALRHTQPDLIVGDAGVVDDGVQTTLNEKQCRDLSMPIPVICLSNTPPSAATEPHGNCERVLFTKPFSPTKLLAEVKRLIPISERRVS